jgi:hypothetical protein
MKDKNKYSKKYEKLIKVIDCLNCLKNGNKDHTIGYELYRRYIYLKNGVYTIKEQFVENPKT